MNGSDFTTPVAADSGKKASRAWIIIVIAALLLVGGFFAFRSFQSRNAKATPTPTPTAAVTPTAEPTEEATPSATPTTKQTPTPTKGVVTSAAAMNIQVLNGSGEAGVAGTAKDFLSEKGYKNLETGNADNFDYANVTIKIKDSMNKFLSTLKTDLSEKYTVNSDVGTLPEDSLFDATVTVGKSQ